MRLLTGGRGAGGAGLRGGKVHCQCSTEHGCGRQPPPTAGGAPWRVPAPGARMRSRAARASAPSPAAGGAEDRRQARLQHLLRLAYDAASVAPELSRSYVTQLRRLALASGIRTTPDAPPHATPAPAPAPCGCGITRRPDAWRAAISDSVQRRFCPRCSSLVIHGDTTRTRLRRCAKRRKGCASPSPLCPPPPPFSCGEGSREQPRIVTR